MSVRKKIFWIDCFAVVFAIVALVVFQSIPLALVGVAVVLVGRLPALSRPKRSDIEEKR
jgi:hypothetical protein